MSPLLTLRALLAAFLLLIFAPQGFAQNSTSTTPATTNTTSSSSSADSSTPPDVYLNVPNLSVGYIGLDVEGLQANINLNANVANLVTINAGVAVSLQKLNLTITEVYAQLELIVRLNRLVDIVERVFETLDSNPQLISGLLNSTTGALGSVAGAAGNVTSGVTSAAGSAVSGVSSVVGGATSAVSGVTSAAGSAVSGVTSAAGSATSAVSA